MNKAIFLDRDGVVNREIGYVSKVEDLELLPDTLDALKFFREKGYLLIIITNQGGVAKGMYSIETLNLIHGKMLDEFAKHKIDIAEVYYCPHHSQIGRCLCRKPDSLMIEKALARFEIDPKRSYFIGDHERDIEAGKKAGIKTILMKSNGSLLNVSKELIF